MLICVWSIKVVGGNLQMISWFAPLLRCGSTITQVHGRHINTHSRYTVCILWGVNKNWNFFPTNVCVRPASSINFLVWIIFRHCSVCVSLCVSTYVWQPHKWPTLNEFLQVGFALCRAVLDYIPMIPTLLQSSPLESSHNITSSPFDWELPRAKLIRWLTTSLKIWMETMRQLNLAWTPHSLGGKRERGRKWIVLFLTNWHFLSHSLNIKLCLCVIFCYCVLFNYLD